MNVDEYGFPIFDEDYDNPEIHVPKDIKEFYKEYLRQLERLTSLAKKYIDAMEISYPSACPLP